MDAYHTLLCGATGGGKTTELRKHHETADCPSVWVNHNDARDVAGYTVHGYKSMLSQLDRYDDWGEVRINYVPENTSPEGATGVAVQVSKDLWDTAGVPVQIIIDECHHALGRGMGGVQSNAGHYALAEGRAFGCKVVAATQNPQNINYRGNRGESTGVPEFKYRKWVGEWATEHTGFMNYYGYPTDDDRFPSERFEVVTMNRQSEILYSGETEQKYAGGM